MDIEKARRLELIRRLEGEFTCLQEVRLRHALFRTATVRADVVAIPRDPQLSSYALAFEVKEPTSPTWQAKHWLHAVRQASDYVYAEIEAHAPAKAYAGRRIAAAFLYPAPPAARYPHADHEDAEFLAGALLLALHWRVGSARLDHRYPERFLLLLGPNDVWRSDKGFTPGGVNLLTGKRTIGSQKVDLLGSLSGFTPNMDAR